jgi:hypothetical protein
VKQDDWNQLRSMLGMPQVATGGVGPSGYARPYPWKQALELASADAPAGARRVPLAVQTQQ